MMKKRYLAVAGMLACIVCLGAFVPALLSPRPDTKANLNRLHKGMTPEEVEAILGEADIDSMGKHGKVKMWKNSDGSSTEVEFHDGLVSDIYLTEGARETLIQKIQRWLGIAILPPVPPARKT